MRTSTPGYWRDLALVDGCFGHREQGVIRRSPDGQIAPHTLFIMEGPT
jgi:hypothetical protein